MNIKIERPTFAPIPFELSLPEKGICRFTISRPSDEETEKMMSSAKEIFVEAFTTTYTKYHENIKTTQSVENWLKLKDGAQLPKWLDEVFEEEIGEWREGKKDLLLLKDEQQQLVGWLSHSRVSEKGEVYLSQGSIKAQWRHLGIANAAFNTILTNHHTREIFPGVHKLLLITRQINEIAKKVFTKMGFKEDLQIDPSVYGSAYDARYVGFHLDTRSDQLQSQSSA